MQVPQVPLSQELGASWPACADSLEDGLVGGHGDHIAGLRELDLKGGVRRLVGFSVGESFEMHRRAVQCPIMSRTASISPSGPQQ